MKRSLNNLIKYSIKSKDGSDGKVKDFLFDDESWIVRYLEADLGKLFSSKRVLIPRVFLGDPNWDEKEFPIELSEELIKEGPDIQ
ncbi:MAG: PRC-barrel domain-containing protein, partial [Bacteroidales bacterium]